MGYYYHSDFENGREAWAEFFLVKIYSFSGNSINEFRNALRKFVYSGNSKMIIDLRGNLGGYLESAVDASAGFADRENSSVGKIGQRRRKSVQKQGL